MQHKWWKCCGVLGAIAPVVVAVSCGTNAATTSSVTSSEGTTSDDMAKLAAVPSGFGQNYILNPAAYNALYDQMGPSDVAIAIIANHKIYQQVLPFVAGDTAWSILSRSAFEFKTHDTPGLGIFVNTFRPQGTTAWLHGTRQAQNYGDYYMLYYINHHWSDLGVSNWHASAREIYEYSYDDC